MSSYNSHEDLIGNSLMQTNLGVYEVASSVTDTFYTPVPQPLPMPPGQSPHSHYLEIAKGGNLPCDQPLATHHGRHSTASPPPSAFMLFKTSLITSTLALSSCLHSLPPLQKPSNMIAHKTNPFAANTTTPPSPSLSRVGQKGQCTIAFYPSPTTGRDDSPMLPALRTWRSNRLREILHVHMSTERNDGREREEERERERE